jgi:hypothetical protein
VVAGSNKSVPAVFNSRAQVSLEFLAHHLFDFVEHRRKVNGFDAPNKVEPVFCLVIEALEQRLEIVGLFWIFAFQHEQGLEEELAGEGRDHDGGHG